MGHTWLFSRGRNAGEKFNQRKTEMSKCLKRPFLPCLRFPACGVQTPGMAVFKQQKVDDLYEIGEELGR